MRLRNAPSQVMVIFEAALASSSVRGTAYRTPGHRF